MYKIQSVLPSGESGDLGAYEKNQDELFDSLNSLQNRVNSVMAVLAKTAGSVRGTNGIKYIEEVGQLDIVLHINPKQSLPKGLAVLHKDLSNRFKCQTKVLIHSTATGFKTDLFKDSTRGSKEVRKDFQIIFTVIYTTEIPEITCYAGSATLTGCATVTRFMGRLVDLYPVEGKNEAAIEEWLETADIIADPAQNKKEIMVQSKSLDAHLATSKFVCGNSATIADYAIYSAIQSVDSKTYGKNVKEYCARMEKI